MKKNNINFDTANKSFGEVIGNGKKYIIPIYQRDYSWNEEQWNDLWEDIISIYEQKPEDREEHYMGYLVLQKQGVNEYRIIDGQQRLTTISLLILSVLQILKESLNTENEERLEIIKKNYIINKSSASLTEEYKITLNRNNNSYYKHDLASLSKNPTKRNIKKTEHLMRKAKDFFRTQLQNKKLNSQQLSELIENCVAYYLLFTVITVGDDINAYKVFETLNARGVQLSTPDLLKNYLFSLIDPNNSQKSIIHEQEEKWSETLDQLGKEEFSKFLRTYWNSQYPISTKTNLFKN